MIIIDTYHDRVRAHVSINRTRDAVTNTLLISFVRATNALEIHSVLWLSTKNYAEQGVDFRIDTSTHLHLFYAIVEAEILHRRNLRLGTFRKASPFTPNDHDDKPGHVKFLVSKSLQGPTDVDTGMILTSFRLLKVAIRTTPVKPIPHSRRTFDNDSETHRLHDTTFQDFFFFLYVSQSGRVPVECSVESVFSIARNCHLIPKRAVIRWSSQRSQKTPVSFVIEAYHFNKKYSTSSEASLWRDRFTSCDLIRVRSRISSI